MKKAMVILLCFTLLFSTVSTAFAAKLSEYSYEELIKLRLRIDQEIMSRPEWKEVTVPAGRYTVGEDIPEGVYSIRLLDEKGYESFIVFGIEYENYEDNGGMLYCESLNERSPVLGKVTLSKGNIVDISGPLVFAPPISPFQF